MSEYCYLACSKAEILLAEGIKERLYSGHYDIIISSATDDYISYQTRRTQILDCKVFIAIITPEFVKCDIYLYELSLALDLKRKIIVIQHDTVQELPAPFPNLRSVRWCKESDFLAEKVYQILEDQNREFLLEDCFFDNDALKRFIWKFEETKIGEQLSQHVTSGEYVSSELQLRDIQTTLITLCEGINKIQETSQPRRKVSRRQFPRDIRRVARRYQDVIAYPLIRQFGRYLDLEEDELDEVEQFSEYGTKEAFWQTIRFWLEKTDSSELTVGTIIKALKECDVNLKGKQMSNAHRKVLKSKLACLVENIQTEPLIPSLMSSNVLCDVTKAYVTAPKTRDQRINRLVDVLMTKEKGLLVFCEVLRTTGYQFVADEILAGVEHDPIVGKPVAVLRPRSMSSATASDPELYVKQIIDEHRLSKASSTSSVFSRRDSTSSTKIATIAPSVSSDQSVDNIETISKGKSEKTKTSRSKYERKVNNDSNVANQKFERKGKGTSSLNCVNGCSLS